MSSFVRSAAGVPINDTLFKDLQRLANDLAIEGIPPSVPPQKFD